MDESSLDAIADQLRRRADAFECFRSDRREISVNFEAGKLKAAQTSQRAGTGLRVVVGGRVAIGGTADPDPAAIRSTVESTLEAAAFGDPVAFQFAQPGKQSATQESPANALAGLGHGRDVFDPAVAAFQPADLAAVGRRILQGLADISQVATVGVSLEAGRHGTAFINSAGQRFDYQATNYNVSIGIDYFSPYPSGGQDGGGDDIFSVWEFQESGRADVDIDALIESARRKFELGRTVVSVVSHSQPGAAVPHQPIVFSPIALSQFLVPLLSGLNGQNVADCVSPLADKRDGAAILDEKITVIDDGTLPGRPGSSPFDDEGVPTQRTPLIDRGRVTNFLLDLRNAATLGLTSTGNASRGLTTPPAPAVSNLMLQPGTTPLAEMIRQIDDGLLIEMLLGVGQGNVSSGDYATPIGLAYKIHAGQIVGRVKDCSIAGNIYQDLKRVAAIEDRGHWYGSACLPHVRLDGIELAAGE